MSLVVDFPQVVEEFKEIKSFRLKCSRKLIILFLGPYNGPSGPSNGPSGPSNDPSGPPNGPFGPPNGPSGPPRNDVYNGPSGPPGDNAFNIPFNNPFHGPPRGDSPYGYKGSSGPGPSGPPGPSGSNPSGPSGPSGPPRGRPPPPVDYRKLPEDHPHKWNDDGFFFDHDFKVAGHFCPGFFNPKLQPRTFSTPKCSTMNVSTKWG